ncbi:hypothetical protein HMPREF0077_0016 [Anaerococcus tetradius ATCC 35098]|uniref:Uncharacterized protein n=1 Tax=Anaerococcus tetradius ATCC 35098 TaxID=525255 RepID=C2CEV8_9FIRM|nr:hypothetical protein HMPREF0077_0016 [Anaerococcus tetradius ATCC 35098]
MRRNLTSKTKSQGEKRRQEKDPSSKASFLVRDDSGGVIPTELPQGSEEESY